MANNERLTKRVKDLEEWTKANEMTGGPQGILEAFAFMALSLFFCSYKNFLYSIILQTGGSAFGEISTKSKPNSSAFSRA